MSGPPPLISSLSGNANANMNASFDSVEGWVNMRGRKRKGKEDLTGKGMTQLQMHDECLIWSCWRVSEVMREEGKDARPIVYVSMRVCKWTEIMSGPSLLSSPSGCKHDPRNGRKMGGVEGHAHWNLYRAFCFILPLLSFFLSLSLFLFLYLLFVIFVVLLFSGGGGVDTREIHPVNRERPWKSSEELEHDVTNPAVHQWWVRRRKKETRGTKLECLSLMSPVSFLTVHCSFLHESWFSDSLSKQIRVSVSRWLSLFIHWSRLSRKQVRKFQRSHGTTIIVTFSNLVPTWTRQNYEHPESEVAKGFDSWNDTGRTSWSKPIQILSFLSHYEPHYFVHWSAVSLIDAGPNSCKYDKVSLQSWVECGKKQCAWWTAAHFEEEEEESAHNLSRGCWTNIFLVCCLFILVLLSSSAHDCFSIFFLRLPSFWTLFSLHSSLSSLSPVFSSSSLLSSGSSWNAMMWWLIQVWLPLLSPPLWNLFHQISSQNWNGDPCPKFWSNERYCNGRIGRWEERMRKRERVVMIMIITSRVTMMMKWEKLGLKAIQAQSANWTQNCGRKIELRL